MNENLLLFIKSYKWKLIWPLLAFILPYFGSYFIFYYFGPDLANASISITYKQAFHYAINNIFALFVSFVLVLFTTGFMFTEKINHDQQELLKRLEDKTDQIKNDVHLYLNKAKIVFESGINEYDDRHLLALKRVLNSLETNNSASINIYAIDNSDPRTWWSDTMTGYLALLSNWRTLYSGTSRRGIYRVFVCQCNELLSPVFVKTITLHSLMGFKTYIISFDVYMKLHTQFLAGNDKYKDIKLNKEILIWLKEVVDQDGNKTETPISLSFNLDKLDQPKNWQSVKCYQSFWEIGSDYNERNNLIDKRQIVNLSNFYNYNISSKDIDIWFEFIANEKNGNQVNLPVEKQDKWEKIPVAYKEFIHFMISKMECCKDASEVNQISNPFPYGIEIKTMNCNDCEKHCSNEVTNENSSKFDFTSYKYVREILSAYYNKVK